jgi:hypothetical protein
LRHKQIEALLVHARSSWRFRWHALATKWILALTGWEIVFFIPSRYESSARVFVDTNTLLRPLLEGVTVTPDTGTQVDLVRRALLGRVQLEKVISETDRGQYLHDFIHGRRRTSRIQCRPVAAGCVRSAVTERQSSGC